MPSPGTGASHELETSISEVALALFAPGTVAVTLNRIAALAVETIDGCDACGIFLVEQDEVTTPAYTDPIVMDFDTLQVRAGEGPCLEALSGDRTVYAADLADDPRWPIFGPAATAAGVRSILAFRLSPERPSALNLYANLPAAFGATDRAKGLIFAALAGRALELASDREKGEKRAANLQEALRTREMIGQAQGILMERERTTADQAFQVLRRASQHLNVKLKEVAQMLVETGEAPGTGHRSEQ